MANHSNTAKFEMNYLLFAITVHFIAYSFGEQLPPRYFKLQPVWTPKLVLLQSYFPDDEMKNALLENSTHHPILDRLTSLQEHEHEKLALAAKDALNEYNKIQELTSAERETIIHVQRLMGHIGQLLERLPIQHAIRTAQYIPIIDLSPLLFNEPHRLLNASHHQMRKTAWEKAVDE